MKIKEQTRKLAAGCSKHCFEVVNETDEVSNHTYGKATLTGFEEIFEEYKYHKKGSITLNDYYFVASFSASTTSWNVFWYFTLIFIVIGESSFLSDDSSIGYLPKSKLKISLEKTKSKFWNSMKIKNPVGN